MISFSNKPLRLLAKLGLLIACVAFLVGLSIFVVALNGKMALGWPSLMVSIWFLAGVVIFAQGILGIYIAKTFEEAKGRKPFIVESTLNLTPGKDTIPR